jgi:hypothetical protein
MLLGIWRFAPCIFADEADGVDSADGADGADGVGGVDGDGACLPISWLSGAFGFPPDLPFETGIDDAINDALRNSDDASSRVDSLIAMRLLPRFWSNSPYLLLFLFLGSSVPSVLHV